jgi:predicted nucleotidyltransferase component of viral defense system
MKVRSYPSPEAFKQALEQRLRAASKTGTDFARRRQLLVFDRLLARAAVTFGDAAVLKGGLALELRLEHARATMDVDLEMTGSSGGLLARLQEAGRQDLGDFMLFEIDPDADTPEILDDGMWYEGMHFCAECRLGGELYGQRFGVNVAFGDPVVGTPDERVLDDALGFAGVPPPTLRLYPIETHVAEKLHAYTLLRERPNSRVKDLPDLALLATVRTLDSGHLRGALEQTFSFRGTHPLPPRLPDPPESWAFPYAVMAREDQLPWINLEEVTAAVRAFLNPVLAGYLDVEWRRGAWHWVRR